MLGYRFTFILLLIGIIEHAETFQRSSKSSIGIIGAGIGGSTAAWFLREELGTNLHIDIFEQGEVGGRTQVFQHNDEVFEVGASIIHEENRYFRELADRMGLKRECLGGDGSEVSIFDGRRLVFNESSWTVVTLYRMLRRYGFSYFYMRQGPQTMLQRFLQLYALQAEGKAFGTPEELLQAVDLYNLTQRKFRNEIEDSIGTSTAADLFAKEFVAGINRIQYNQGNDINALAGMVSLLPTIDGRLFKIKGGNRLLPERLISAANASLHQGVRLTRVHRTQDGLFTLHHMSSSADELVKEVHRCAGGDTIRAHQPGVHRVQGAPHAGEYVMVSEDAQTPFSVIGPQKDLPNGLRIYKLFSQQPLANATVDAIFSNLTVLASREWKAYPHFSPPERFPPFQLVPGLYLNNAWENAASAMEMSAVAAKNCALLMAQHFSSMSSSNGSPDVANSSMDGAKSEL